MPGEERPLIDILHAARGGESDPELMMFDLPDLFGATNQKVTQSPRATGKVGMDLNCVSFSKVFVLWRPWGSCVRCKLALTSDDPEERIDLPKNGDYTCPHTQENEYKAIKDMCLRGEAVLQKEEFFNVRSDDSRCVHILWWKLDEVSMEKLKSRQGADRVYPPNPEAAFKKDKPPKKNKDSRGDDTVTLSTSANSGLKKDE